MGSIQPNPTHVGWVGLGWVGLGWVGLDLCHGLGWIKFFLIHYGGLDKKISFNST